MSRAMHIGDVRVDEDGRFRGIVSGTLTIAAGRDVDMAGMINGSLVVEPDARVIISGMVNGEIVDRGGRISITGMVNS